MTIKKSGAYSWQMSEVHPDYTQPSDEPEYGVPIEAIDKYDFATAQYLDACADYAEKPVRRNFEKIADRAQEQADSFVYALNTIQSDTPLKELTEVGLRLLLDSGVKRVSYLNILLGTDALENFNFEMPAPITWEPEEEASLKSTTISSLYGVFEHIISEDTNKFMNLVEETEPAKKLEFNQALVGHAIDISKIALGATIAILATRAFNRKSK